MSKLFQTSFGRAFKRLTGLTPLGYQGLQKQKMDRNP